MNEQGITIFCICDEIVKSYGLYENSTCKMTTAEVMTFAIISGLHYHADYQTTRLICFTIETQLAPKFWPRFNWASWV